MVTKRFCTAFCSGGSANSHRRKGLTRTYLEYEISLRGSNDTFTNSHERASEASPVPESSAVRYLSSAVPESGPAACWIARVDPQPGVYSCGCQARIRRCSESPHHGACVKLTDPAAALEHMRQELDGSYRSLAGLLIAATVLALPCLVCWPVSVVMKRTRGTTRVQNTDSNGDQAQKTAALQDVTPTVEFTPIVEIKVTQKTPATESEVMTDHKAAGAAAA